MNSGGMPKFESTTTSNEGNGWNRQWLILPAFAQRGVPAGIGVHIRDRLGLTESGTSEALVVQREFTY
jgi:hypothetical protein